MRVAHRNGISLESFWRMTPWQLKTCAQVSADKETESHDKFAWFMWHLAALFRAKKMPDIKVFLSNDLKNKKPVEAVNEDAILAWLMTCKENHKAKTEGKHKK